MNKLAIIGFGCAGYCAAAEARKYDPEAQIDVYTDHEFGPYNPMLTTYFAKGDINYEALFPFGNLEQIEAELGLNLHCGTPVLGIDTGETAAVLADGTKARYDKILISTGASALVPKVAGWDLPGVFKMRTVEDALYLRKVLEDKKARSGLVVGASWVGIKVVEDLLSQGMDCTLVDGAGWAFPSAVFPETAERIHKDLEEKGVKLAFGKMLDHIVRQDGGQLTSVMKDGSQYTSDIIAICVGVQPNVSFVRGSGLAVNRGILVDEHMQTSCADIYAAGDCCEAYDIQSKQHRNIGVWLNARKQGAVAGANMVGVREEFGGNALVNLAHYLDYDFISIGDAGACGPEDQWYEYEDKRYYLRAARTDEQIKCINMIGTAEANGVVKNLFVKSFENREAGMDVGSICYLKEKGFPDTFIEFLGGKTVD